jgi:hypothetical protein
MILYWRSLSQFCSQFWCQGYNLDTRIGYRFAIEIFNTICLHHWDTLTTVVWQGTKTLLRWQCGQHRNHCQTQHKMYKERWLLTLYWWDLYQGTTYKNVLEIVLEIIVQDLLEILLRNCSCSCKRSPRQESFWIYWRLNWIFYSNSVAKSGVKVITKSKEPATVLQCYLQWSVSHCLQYNLC